jgi:hypothetical protein
MKYVLLCSLLISSGAFAANVAVKGSGKVFASDSIGASRVSGQKVGFVAANKLDVSKIAWRNDAKFLSLVSADKFGLLAISEQSRFYNQFLAAGMEKNFLIQHKAAAWVNRLALEKYDLIKHD